MQSRCKQPMVRRSGMSVAGRRHGRSCYEAYVRHRTFLTPWGRCSSPIEAYLCNVISNLDPSGGARIWRAETYSLIVFDIVTQSLKHCRTGVGFDVTAPSVCPNRRQFSASPLTGRTPRSEFCSRRRVYGTMYIRPFLFLFLFFYYKFPT